MAKAIHWTKTPEGRARMSAHWKRWYKEKAKAPKPKRTYKRKVKVHAENPEFGRNLAYLFGKVETTIEVYADRLGVPRAALAAGVADLLRAQARG
jgi:hypothetical protein